MIYTYPDYYKDFKCIADRCEDTCCAGWQIVIDDESLSRYKKYIDESTENDKKTSSDNHTFNERLNQSIDWQEGVFKQDGCRRCAFLNDSNLCDLYTALGEDSLCHTCASYPRHTEEYEGVREVTLSLSCPEVARMLLEKTDKATFYEVNTRASGDATDESNYDSSFDDSDYDDNSDYGDNSDYDDDFEDFDMLMFGILQDARSVMIGIMQDRTMDVVARVNLLWCMAEDMQDTIDEGAIFDCQDIIESYEQLIGHVDKAQELLSKMERSYSALSARESYTFDLSIFKYLYQMEVLNEEWEVDVDQASLALYGQDAEYYEKLSTEFDCWLHTYKPNWQIQCEQIVVYFLATYLCGAVYDGWVAAKVKMSVASIFYIHRMLLAQWLRQGKALSDHDIIRMVYRYSRELEHSDINLDELESCFAE